MKVRSGACGDIQSKEVNVRKEDGTVTSRLRKGDANNERRVRKKDVEG